MNLLEPLLDLLFPKFCVECGSWGTYLCRSCCSKIAFSPTPLCPGCMRPISKPSVHVSCRSRTNLDGLLVASKFEGPIKILLTDVKYSYYFDEVHTITVLLAHYLIHAKVLDSIKPRILLPIPLHIQKQRERGFNQSELLATDLSRIISVPTTSKILRKVRKTRSQAGLDREKRLNNVENAFQVSIKIQTSDTLLLVDDVVTTGATFSAAAKVLKAAGAGKVYGVAVAHGH